MARLRIRNAKGSNGFTLPELLLVIVVIGVLTASVMAVMKPGKGQAVRRDAVRVADVVIIANAVSQFSAANNGTLPSSANITSKPTEICKTGGSCAGLVDLGELTAGARFLPDIPRDPKCGDTTTDACNANGIGYQISRSAEGRIVVSAPAAENGRAISTTK